MKMDLKHALLNEPAHKERVRQVVAYVGKSRTRFKELMDLFQSENYRLCQRASWPLSYIVENNPEFIANYYKPLLKILAASPHNTVTRNILRLLQFVKIPESFAGQVMNHCFDLLLKPKEPVANKAFSLTILANLAKRYPEIKNEILLCIEEQWPHASAGFRSRARKVKHELADIA